MVYAPDRGDIVLLNLSPQAGSEMAGEHRSIVLSESKYSIATGYAVISPITTKIKGSPFEVQLPPGLKAKGCVVASEIRTVDYMACGTRFMERAPDKVTRQVQDIVCLIVGCPTAP